MSEMPTIKVNNIATDFTNSFQHNPLRSDSAGSVSLNEASKSRKLLEAPSEEYVVARRGSTNFQQQEQRSSKRKFSIPAHLGLDYGNSARRRLSNVSDVVTRKLSNTIGWRISQIPCQEIVEIGRSLCSQYIRSRLRRAGFFNSNKKCIGLQRLRSAVHLPIAATVFPELLGLALELERMYPQLYVNVTRQASSLPGGRFTNDKEPGAVFTAISRELIKQDVSWVKIVSLYAVAGGLAIDCVRQSHYDYLPSIIEAMEEVLEDDLAQWIQEKGGWLALSVLVRPPLDTWPWLRISIVASSVITILVILFIIIFYCCTWTKDYSNSDKVEL